MVVQVLITSCHVSLNPNKGPEKAHTTRIATANTNVTGLPVTRDVHFAKRVNRVLDLVGLTP